VTIDVDDFLEHFGVDGHLEISLGDEINYFLDHHGVKGQKWGVRKERQTSAGTGSTKKEDLSPLEKQVKTKLDSLGYNEAQLDRRFGPEADAAYANRNEKKPLLTNTQKKLLVGVGGVAVLGAAAYGLHKYGKNYGPITNEVNKMSNLKIQSELGGYLPGDINKLSTKRLELQPGSIVKRLSMTKETNVRDQFFAAVDDRDVERYKAILPIYWKSWTGKRKPEGFVVSLKAKDVIKAPSERETLDIFKSMLNDDFDVPFRPGKTNLRGFLKSKIGFDADDDVLSRRYLHEFAGQWHDPSNEFTKGMFRRVKSLGFNAVPDMNDANNLANAPHIFLDGNKLFDIVGHERHGVDEIRRAQRSIAELVHLAFWRIEMEIDDFLEHHGVKGQKWGVRRAAKRISKREIESFRKRDADIGKVESKNPTFKREVKETRKGHGISIVKETGHEVTPIGRLTTSRILGEFKNSKGEKVSEDFANAVLDKAVSQEKRERMVKIGALFAAAAIGGTVIGRARRL
jgi:hypothetical protein